MQLKSPPDHGIIRTYDSLQPILGQIHDLLFGNLKSKPEVQRISHLSSPQPNGKRGMFLIDILQTRFKQKRTDAFLLMLGMNSEDKEG